jgi:hypothetical protein
VLSAILLALSAQNREINAPSVPVVASCWVILASRSALPHSLATLHLTNVFLASLLARLVLNQSMTAQAAFRPNLSTTTIE